MTAHVFPNATLELGTKLESLNNVDTLKCGLIASGGPYAWNGTSQGHKFIADFLAGSGGGALTEVSTSSTGYNRIALTSVAFTTTGLVNTLTCATIQWTATANWSAIYAFFYDSAAVGASTDANTPLICYWDFGGTVSVVNGGQFTLTINASGLVTWTAS